MNEPMTCPNCGKEYPVGAIFCPFCGALLPPDAGAAASDPAEQLRNRYGAYAAWVRQSLEERNFGRIAIGWLSGNDAFKRSGEHERFLNDVQALCAPLLEQYRAGEARSTLPEVLRFALIDCHADALQETEWMFLAAEMPFVPFLDLLTKEEAAALYPDYKALRRRQPGLQPQKTIQKKLKTIAEI